MSVQKRIKLAMFAGLIAVSAYAGAAGLITGELDLGAVVNGRLPFHSPVFAGIALALAVGLPMTVAAHRAATDVEGYQGATVIAGVMLIGWIVVELAFVRTFSWLQPVCVLAGFALVLAGKPARRTTVARGGR
ncbi:hypothetical protein [Amycolatopsis sp. NPDC059657]|uniref:hypothetical protein n=1 Tax=Amycolatopsis sp. NPDC059657 TaxID=3346899 RepID=UPI00366E1E8E